MMILEHLATYLARNKVGRIGKEIFVHTMPAYVEEGILLLPPDSGFVIDLEMKDRFRDVFKLVVRSGSITKGNQIMQREVLPVIELQNETVDGHHFNFVRPLTLPLPYIRDESGGYEISVVLEFCCYETL